MVDFTLVPYAENLKFVWDKVVAHSRNGNFLHLRDYMGYHAHRFEEQSVIVHKHGKPVAVFPCNRVGDHFVSHGGLTYAGLIYGDEVRAVDVLAIFSGIAEHYRSLGCRSISYKAIPHIFHRYPAEEDLYALHRLGARLVRRDLSSVIQMSNRIKLSDSRKNTIGKGKKVGVDVREGAFFSDFHRLLEKTLKKHEAKPVHDPEELQLLQHRLPSQIRLFGAFAAEDLLAGALIYDFGSVAHSQYLANSEQGKSVGALDFLLAHLLDTEYRQHQFFSFGISTEQQGRHLNEGLIFQKEGFGARGVVHDFFEWEI